MNTKRFDKRIHDLCDTPAKEALITFFKKKYNVIATVNPNRYGADLLFKNNQTVDVQMRQHWNSSLTVFPFQEVHVPVRNFAKSSNQKIQIEAGSILWKEKSEMPTYYCVLRYDLKRAIIFKRDDILASRIDKVYIPSMGDYDTFFSIDQTKGKYFDLD